MGEIANVAGVRKDGPQWVPDQLNDGSGVNSDVVAQLWHFSNLVSLPGRENAAITKTLGRTVAYDALRSDLVQDSARPEGAKPLKVSDATAKFLKEQLGVKDQYIDGDTVHFKLEKPIGKDFKGAPPMWFKEDVSFKIKASDHKIEITDLKGVMARPDYSPWIKIIGGTFERHLDIETGEETGYSATIRGGRLNLYLDKTISIPKSVFTHLEQVVKDNLTK